jgi:uncharacterized membrane protein
MVEPKPCRARGPRDRVTGILRCVEFNHRYWGVAAPLWLLATVIFAVVAAVASPTWQEAVYFAFSWGLFALGLWWFLATVRTYRAGERAESPQAILDARLARGEITIDEYRRLKDAMGNS